MAMAREPGGRMETQTHTIYRHLESLQNKLGGALTAMTEARTNLGDLGKKAPEGITGPLRDANLQIERVRDEIQALAVFVERHPWSETPYPP